MDFFFPDSQDQIDPSFDFERESSSPDRVRQRDDRYAHEVISPAPYTGMLLSKALVDGPGKQVHVRAAASPLPTRGPSLLPSRRMRRPAARHTRRLRRLQLRSRGEAAVLRRGGARLLRGVRLRLRDLGRPRDPRLHPDATDVVRPLREAPQEWTDRQQLTLEYAAEFLRRHRAISARFEPLGVAQGWSPTSYAHAVQVCRRIGYDYIALGGMVPLKTTEIEACLKAIEDVRRPETRLHLLGVTRTELVKNYERYGVASFDSTSPFRQAFKDDRDNYYAPERKYLAIRVMQIDSNNRLKQRVLAGATRSERGARDSSKLPARRSPHTTETSAPSMTPLEALAAYDAFLGEPDRQGEYWRTLHDRPWRSCACGICAEVGIQVVIFRGTERNKRRGFHNLFVFNQLLHKELDSRMRELRVPALRLAQGPSARDLLVRYRRQDACIASPPSRASDATTTPRSAATSGPRCSRTSTRSAPTSSRRRR